MVSFNRHDRPTGRGGVRLLAVLTALCSLTCGQQTRFTVLPLYCKENFSGRDLGSQNIVVTPLLAGSGILRHEQITPEKQIEAVRDGRRDLGLVRPAGFEDAFIRKFGPDSLESAYDKLYKGSMVDLQTDSSLWKMVGSDYLMVLKLARGLAMKSIDGRTARIIRVEGELWECDSMEVVWRTAVDCYCRNDREPSATLLTTAVCRIFGALPKVLPGYGKNKW
jgi:hypothetical protein